MLLGLCIAGLASGAAAQQRQAEPLADVQQAAERQPRAEQPPDEPAVEQPEEQQAEPREQPDLRQTGQQAEEQQTEQQTEQQAEQQTEQQAEQQTEEQTEQQTEQQAEEQAGQPAGQQQEQQRPGEESDEQQEEQQPAQVSAQSGGACAMLPGHDELTQALREIVAPGDPRANGGLGNHVWAAAVDREGNLCMLTRSGDSFDEQWPGSRSIAASKAYTANAFSLPGFALSTANLYWPVQPGNSLYGTPAANPLDVSEVYRGSASAWGTPDDPLLGQRIGGTVAFGGGLALYTSEGDLIGALGISGDESCTDHVIAWKLRHELDLDNVPRGASSDSDDNIIHDLTVDPASGSRTSASGYGHPTCSPAAQHIAEDLSRTAPAGREE